MSPHGRAALDATALAMAYRRPWEVASHLAGKFWRDECPQRAASLAFTTLISLVPFLAVAFAMLKGFGGLRPIQQRLESVIYTHLVTTSSLQAADYLERFTAGVHAGAIGALGFLAFILTSVSLLNTVGGAFNRVWGVEERRSLKDRFLTFFTLTILGPVLLGASISLTGSIPRSPVWSWLPISGLGPALRFAVPFLFTWAGFLLLYLVIPSAPLRLRPALLGSLVVAAAWELLKIGFEAYVTSMAGYGKIYGPLSVIPVFLLWLYVSWLMALLGFEVCFFLQHPETARGAVAWRGSGRTVPIAEAIRTLVAVAQAFAAGSGPVRVRQVAERLALPEATAFTLLTELERKRYLARVAAPAEAYLPRVDPAGVRIADLWRALGGAAGSAEGDALGRLLAGAAEASTRALGDITVQDLIDAVPSQNAAGAPRPASADAAEPA